MHEQEQRLSPLKIEITNDFTGVRLEGIRKDRIPNADLIQTVMNASACVLFDLSPSFSVEGGLEGKYKEYPVQLSNWSDALGISEDNFSFKGTDTDVDGINEILNFYEQFLGFMFEESEEFFKNPSLQTTEAVWGKLKDVMRKLGGNTLPPRVMTLLVNDEIARRFLRGPTDKEIADRFVPPPFDWK